MDLKNILVASDLSERSDRAIHRAAQLAVQHNSRLHLLYVVDDALPARIAREVQSSAKEHLEASIGAFAADLKGRIETEVAFGTIWKSISAAARDADAGLVVLGSHRSRGMQELFRGTTLERVAKACKCGVLMVQDDAQSEYLDVTVGVDFSASSTKAAIAAVQLAPNAEITLASTYHIFFREFIDRAEPGDADIEAERKRIETDLREKMTEFRKGLPERAKGYEQALLEGGPAHRLSENAEKQGSELICVGSHGRHWLADALLGSVGSELLYTAPCDVLIVK